MISYFGHLNTPPLLFAYKLKVGKPAIRPAPEQPRTDVLNSVAADSIASGLLNPALCQPQWTCSPSSAPCAIHLRSPTNSLRPTAPHRSPDRAGRRPVRRLCLKLESPPSSSRNQRSYRRKQPSRRKQLRA